MVTQADGAAGARAIKGSVQQNGPFLPKRWTSANATGAEPVAATGRKFVLYRPRPENPTIRI